MQNQLKEEVGIQLDVVHLSSAKLQSLHVIFSMQLGGRSHIKVV